MNKNVYIGAYIEVKTTLTLNEIFDGTPFEDHFSDVTPEYWEELPEDRLYLIPNLLDRGHKISINTDVDGLVESIDLPKVNSSFKDLVDSYEDEISFMKSIVEDPCVIIKFGVIIYKS